MRTFFPFALALSFAACTHAPETKVGSPEPGNTKVYSLRAPLKGELDRLVQVYQLGSAEWENGRGIYFASFEPAPKKVKNPNQADSYGFMPAIVRKAHKEKPGLALFSDLKNSGWVGAAALTSKNFVWAFLDHKVEGGAGSVTVFFSQDDGVSWRELSQIIKDSFENHFESFSVDESGRGLVILRQDYTSLAYETTDFGRSWSKPRIYASERAEKTLIMNCAFDMWSPAKLEAGCKLPKEALTP